MAFSYIEKLEEVSLLCTVSRHPNLAMQAASWRPPLFLYIFTCLLGGSFLLHPLEVFFLTIWKLSSTLSRGFQHGMRLGVCTNQ